MYHFQSRVRYSEVDKNKKLDLTSIINYFQDCSTFHCEDIGMGLPYLTKENRVWLMNAWQIVVNRFPQLGEDIVVSTWPYDFNAMYGYRNFLLSDRNNNVLAYANSIWVYMDTISYKPVKLSDKDLSGFNLEPPYKMDYAPRKIAMPKELETFSSFPVVRSNIDTNNHVNNGQYIKMAEEFLPENFNVSVMRAEYRKQAVLGDIIHPMAAYGDNTCSIVLANEAGNPYTILEFIR